MKINIEDYLQHIDRYFQDKSQKDITMIYIIVVLMIFSFAYLLFWDSSFEEFEKTRKNVVYLEKKIARDQAFLQKNTAMQVTKLEQEIQNLNAEMILNKDNNAYIKTQIETISSLIYDEISWGEYLDSISTNAQKYHIKLLKLTNQYAKNSTAFGHILDISLIAQGNYIDTLKFINSLEQSELVVDIHDLNIKAEPSLHTDLNISVWGITY